jgi:hypothetical protein
MLNDQRIDAIFKEMDGLVIELASDPSSLGPQYFQDLIATCRNYLNRVGLVLNELDREHLTVSSEVRRLEAAYELEHDDILANDQSVKDLGSSIEDRKAAVGWRLREQRAALTEARGRLHSLKAVHKVVAYRNKELHATMTAIRDQKRLMTAEIRSGSFYGDERTTSLRPGEDDGGGMTTEELAQMFSEPPPTAENSDQLSSENTSQPAELSVEGAESDALRFLSEGVPRRLVGTATAVENADWEDLLKDV